MSSRILVTGFGPFGSFDRNPSQILAEGSGRPYEILEVSYAAVDAWVDGLDPDRFDLLLLMGVAGGSEKMRLERYGHNRRSRLPDVRGWQPTPRELVPGGPWKLRSTLWDPLRPRRWVREHPDFILSPTAGGYLCNFVLYQALRRFPSKRVGFLHVPPASAMPLERQAELLSVLLRDLGV